MPENPHAFVASLSRMLTLSALMACGACPAMAQHTVVQKNGEGKIETDYNAGEKVTQMRTLGADGKLQQKVNYEYLPGYYVAQQTDTSYWPNGEVHRVARNSYDESANFTAEFIELFDQSGKQIAGHKLTHDPWTGVYRCSEWNLAEHDYRSIECPSGEDESGGAVEAKKFTYSEVMHNLEVARKTAHREQKVARMQPAAPVKPPMATAQHEVGLVLPSQLRPGERVSGTVVKNFDEYDENPGVFVTRVAVPFESAGEASRLSGWWFEAPGEKPQRADGPITLVVPRRASGLNITFRQAGNPAHNVSKTLTSSQLPSEKPPSPKSFHAAAFCLKEGLCVVSGPFSGDSSKTFAAFQDRPATIVAESTDTAYISVPELTEPGARPLFISEGSRMVVLPVVVGEFEIRNNHRDLASGQTLIVFPALDGPGGIADSAWQPGNFPATNLVLARQFIPEFQLPNRENEEEREEEGTRETEKKEERTDERENKGGEILLVVRNVTPEQILLRGSTNNMLVFRLSDEAFSRGEFKYDLVVEAKKAGKVDVKGYVIPFLAPVAGQEFSVKPAVP